MSEKQSEKLLTGYKGTSRLVFPDKDLKQLEIPECFKHKKAKQLLKELEDLKNRFPVEKNPDGLD